MNCMTSFDQLDTNTLESLLLIKEFGHWARRGVKEGELSMPGWVQEIVTGYKEDPKELLIDISDEYGMRVDKALTQLPKESSEVIVSIYVGGVSATALARNSKRYRDRKTIYKIRDNALSALWGMLNPV